MRMPRKTGGVRLQHLGYEKECRPPRTDRSNSFDATPAACQNCYPQRETTLTRARIYMAVMPPSTNSNEPVTYDASLDARKRMQAATSSAVPGRLSMVRLAASSLYWVTVWPAA